MFLFIAGILGGIFKDDFMFLISSKLCFVIFYYFTLFIILIVVLLFLFFILDLDLVWGPLATLLEVD